MPVNESGDSVHGMLMLKAAVNVFGDFIHGMLTVTRMGATGRWNDLKSGWERVSGGCFARNLKKMW